MKFVHIDTLTVMTGQQLRERFPDTNINPARIGDASLASKGCARLYDDPSDTPWNKTGAYGDPFERDGKWVREWILTDMSSDAAQLVLNGWIDNKIREIDYSFKQWVGGYLTEEADQVYDMNQADVAQYRVDGTIGPWMQIIINRHGLTADQVADFIEAEVNKMNLLGLAAEDVRQWAKVKARTSTSPEDFDVFWPAWDNGVIWPDGNPTTGG